MGVKAGLAALGAALCIWGSAAAQDVTLVAREGGIVLNGTLQGYDGEFYRISTSYGLLTVDGQGVICEGPACPELTAPKAVMRVVGSPDAAALLPVLFQAFASERGLVYESVESEDYAARILDPESRKDLAEISFAPLPPDQATASLEAGAADLKLAYRAEADQYLMAYEGYLAEGKILEADEQKALYLAKKAEIRERFPDK